MATKSEKNRFPKRVLYAVQATGNGHLSRCLAFYPILCKYTEVDILLSGIQGDLKIPFQIKYKLHGLGFIFGKRGGIDYLRTLISFKPLRLIIDILRLDLSSYDMVINDFEPVSAWACLLQRKYCVALSHQASFLSLRTPRPRKRNRFAEFVFRNFAPCKKHFGLHYKEYGQNIFTPVVRQEIRQISTDHNEKHIIVYLPAFSEEFICQHLSSFNEYNWSVFSKHANEIKESGNITVYPVGTPFWKEKLKTASFVIIGGGFEGTSEMLYLGKKLMVVPMTDQYEQLCNAEALSRLGVWITNQIDENFEKELKKWLRSARVIELNFPDHSDQIIQTVLSSQELK